jgi:phage/plasmid-associated DNA primase
MGYIKGFGFRVFRLREAKEVDEFLLYNCNSKSYNQYSMKRVVSILMRELIDSGVDLIQFVKDIIGDDKKAKVNLFIENLIMDEYVLIDNIGYQPSDDVLYIEDEKKFFNTYKKTKILEEYVLNYKGKFPNIKKLILNLVGNNKEEYEYFTSWLAWKLQNPLKRLPTSIILQGEHGTGKTKFCDLVLKTIFGKNFIEISQTDINKDHNDYIMGKEVIVANEVIHNDNRMLVPDKLKSYVTDEYISINKKFKDTIYSRNYSQWIFVTNNIVPLKIEKGDRRYSVFKSKKLKDGFTIVGSLLKNKEEEVKGFIYYLMNIDVEYDYVASPLENQAKKDIIKYSQNTIDDFLEYAVEIGGLDLLYDRLSDGPNYVGMEREFNIHYHNDELLVNTAHLFNLYRAFCKDSGIKITFGRTGFTRYIKSLGYENKSFNNNKDKPYRVILFNKNVERDYYSEI